MPALRSSQTIVALRAAQEAGIIDAMDAGHLEAAWMLASRIRNQIMLMRGRGSDSLPSDNRELASLAELLGYGPGSPPTCLPITVASRDGPGPWSRGSSGVRRCDCRRSAAARMRWPATGQLREARWAWVMRIDSAVKTSPAVMEDLHVISGPAGDHHHRHTCTP